MNLLMSCKWDVFLVLCCLSAIAQGQEVPELPSGAQLAFEENWETGKLDEKKWYVLRKKWGDGNHGVVPENVKIEQDDVQGRRQNVLVCTAHGDEYEGPVVGLWGKQQRVGGVAVTKQFFASGRFEVVMKVGSTVQQAGGPQNPARPSGCIPAVWTFAYRWVEGKKEQKNSFLSDVPLYNPHMPAYGIAANEYWSELDFPEFGKQGDFTKGLYNTFCQKLHDPLVFDVSQASDGKYHTFTTEWRTKLQPMPGITDQQVVEHEGFWWVQDKNIPFEQYAGNPLKRLAKDEYALYTGDRATHWIDGKKVGENRRFVPSMAAQLNVGVWLPHWAGPAAWKVSRVSFGKIRIWQYADPGDVRGVLTQDISNNFDVQGRELKK